MNEYATSRNWRREQRVEFGKRLTWARERAGFKKTSDAIRSLKQEFGGSWRTVYSHESGERVPDDNETLEMYCTKYEVSRDFLLFGSGPEQDEYFHSATNGSETEVNQVPDLYKIRTSQYGSVRYIPIVTASELNKILAGERALAAMSGGHLPVPKDLLAGPNSFVLQIASDDQSMVGSGPVSFPPLSHIVIDPDRDIMPLDFALVQPKGWKMPILRQLESAFPYNSEDPHYPFELHALNPKFKAITVNHSDECEVVGRLVYVAQAL